MSTSFGKNAPNKSAGQVERPAPYHVTVKPEVTGTKGTTHEIPLNVVDSTFTGSKPYSKTGK